MENIMEKLVPGKKYHIEINGQKAVDMAYAILNSKCYSVIHINGSFAAQMEVAIDEPGMYNGRPNKWVSFGYIPYEMIEKVINWLSENGFSGFFTIIQQEDEQDSDYVPNYPAYEITIPDNFKNEGEKTMEIFKNGYKYELTENDPFGYRINKYELKNGKYELIDFIIGVTKYSLLYYFDHPETRYDNHKNF